MGASAGTVGRVPGAVNTAAEGCGAGTTPFDRLRASGMKAAGAWSMALRVDGLCAPAYHHLTSRAVRQEGVRNGFGNSVLPTHNHRDHTHGVVGPLPGGGRGLPHPGGGRQRHRRGGGLRSGHQRALPALDELRGRRAHRPAPRWEERDGGDRRARALASRGLDRLLQPERRRGDPRGHPAVRYPSRGRRLVHGAEAVRHDELRAGGGARAGAGREGHARRPVPPRLDDLGIVPAPSLVPRARRCSGPRGRRRPTSSSPAAVCRISERCWRRRT